MSAPAEGAKETFITENGCASDDVIADDGNIYERNGFSTSHVARRSCGATRFGIACRDPAIKPSPSCNSMPRRPFGAAVSE
jgi:hypothetical protein